jgi:isopentenyl-diphosphate delta-isomerase
MSDLATIQQRKTDHIQINLERDVQARGVTSGFDHYRFVHAALPELNLTEVDLRTTFFGRTLEAPIVISSMTGGVERGWEIVRRLAAAAQALGCAIGVGSQRAAIEDPGRARYFTVRDIAPDVFLLANLGAVQLNYGYGPDECRRAVEMIGADALILHLNPLQEALQPEGNRDFSSLLRKIAAVCVAIDVPVVVKEVGCGISTGDAHRLADAGVAAIDVSGAGGTSWSAVEHHRAGTSLSRRLSETFIDWGIPTATSLGMVQRGAPGLPLIASGGLRTGLDAAKAIALGANLAGFAGPLLKAAASGEGETFEALTALIEELRLAMFCSGAGTVAQLKRTELIAGQDGLGVSRRANGRAETGYRDDDGGPVAGAAEGCNAALDGLGSFDSSAMKKVEDVYAIG